MKKNKAIKNQKKGLLKTIKKATCTKEGPFKVHFVYVA